MDWHAKDIERITMRMLVAEPNTSIRCGVHDILADHDKIPPAPCPECGAKRPIPLYSLRTTNEH